MQPRESKNNDKNFVPDTKLFKYDLRFFFAMMVIGYVLLQSGLSLITPAEFKLLSMPSAIAFSGAFIALGSLVGAALKAVNSVKNFLENHTTEHAISPPVKNKLKDRMEKNKKPVKKQEIPLQATVKQYNKKKPAKSWRQLFAELRVKFSYIHIKEKGLSLLQKLKNLAIHPMVLLSKQLLYVSVMAKSKLPASQITKLPGRKKKSLVTKMLKPAEEEKLTNPVMPSADILSDSKDNVKSLSPPDTSTSSTQRIAASLQLTTLSSSHEFFNDNKMNKALSLTTSELPPVSESAVVVKQAFPAIHPSEDVVFSSMAASQIENKKNQDEMKLQIEALASQLVILQTQYAESKTQLSESQIQLSESKAQIAISQQTEIVKVEMQAKLAKVNKLFQLISNNPNIAQNLDPEMFLPLFVKLLNARRAMRAIATPSNPYLEDIDTNNAYTSSDYLHNACDDLMTEIVKVVDPATPYIPLRRY